MNSPGWIYVFGAAGAGVLLGISAGYQLSERKVSVVDDQANTLSVPNVPEQAKPDSRLSLATEMRIQSQSAGIAYATKALLERIDSLDEPQVRKDAIFRSVVSDFLSDRDEAAATAAAGAMLTQLNDERRLSLLEIWLDRFWVVGVKANGDRLADLVRDATGTIDEERDQDISALVTKVAIRKGAPAGEILAFSKGAPKAGSQLSLLLSLRPEAVSAACKEGAIDAKDLGDLAAQAKLNPQCLKRLLAQADTNARQATLQTYSEATLKQCPELAISLAAEFAVVEFTDSVRENIVYHLLQVDPVELSQWLGGMESKDRLALLDKAFNSVGIGAFGEKLDESAARTYLSLRLGQAAPDPKATLRAFDRLKDLDLAVLTPYLERLPPELRVEAAFQVYQHKLHLLRKAGESDVSSFISGAPAEIQQDLRRDYIVSLGSTDLEAAASAIDELADPEERTKAKVALLSSPWLKASSTERIGAIRTLLNQGLGEEDASKLILSILSPERVTFIGDYSPQRHVAQWKEFVDEMPASALKGKVVEAFTQLWAPYDPAAASEWIAAMPPGQIRDLAAGKLVTYSKDDPEAAISNAAAISNKSLRAKAVADILKTWGRIDPQYARKLIEQSPLPADEKDEAFQSLTARTNVR